MRDNLLPSEEMSKAIEEIIAQMRQGESETASDLVGSLMRRGLTRILQESLEEEVTDFLGRGHYERSDEPARQGYRNGYADKTVKTAEGRLRLRRPRVRDAEEPFESAVLKRLGALEERLEGMAIEMYVRGLSTRDIEETLTDEDGKALLSRSSISRLTERLYQEYEAFAGRDLSEKDVVYLFVDGVYEAVRSYTNNQAILCAWAILSDGTKELLHLSAAGSESSESWRAFFEEMTARGLRQPLLVIHDGSAALRAAIRENFPESERQRSRRVGTSSETSGRSCPVRRAMRSLQGSRRSITPPTGRRPTSWPSVLSRSMPSSIPRPYAVS